MDNTKTTRPVKYKLIGGMAGRTGVFFGTPFVNGEATISAEQHANTGHVLVRDYSAQVVDVVPQTEASPDQDVRVSPPIGDAKTRQQLIDEQEAAAEREITQEEVNAAKAEVEASKANAALKKAAADKEKAEAETAAIESKEARDRLAKAKADVKAKTGKK